MEDKDLVYLLSRKLDDIRECMPELQAGIAGLFAPANTPRPEVLAALQIVATAADVPARCPNEACRRSGMCCSESAWEPPCEALWTEDLADCLNHMAIGIALSAFRIESRNAAIHKHLTEAFGLSKEPPAATARRKKRPA